MTAPGPIFFDDRRPLGRRRRIWPPTLIILPLLFAATAALADPDFNSAESPPKPKVIRTNPDAFSQKIAAMPGPGAIVVMAAWCAPCRKELPALVRLHDKYADGGLEMLGMSIDYAGPDVVASMVAEHEVTFPVYWVGEAGMRRFAIKAIPLLMLVRDGRIVERIEGIRKESELDGRLRELIESAEADPEPTAATAPAGEDTP